MLSPIPIENLYYLFCYAWNRLDEGNAIAVGGSDSPELQDMLAKVLATGIKHLIRRGLDRGYVPVVEQMGTVRGRIDMQESLRLVMQRAPQLTCRFDELLHDVLHNQILKATIVRLCRLKSLDRGLRSDLQGLYQVFRDVQNIRVTKHAFRQFSVHRNNAFYDFLMKICELIHDLTLPEENGTDYQFTEILRDERKMAQVFEDFVRNFYRIELHEFKVTPLQLRWDAIAKSSDDLSLMPTMRTDIHLENLERRVIIDTKYYARAIQERYEKISLRSENLYQLFAYLKNAEALGGTYSNVEGILLYPMVADSLDVNIDIQGHRVRVATINFNQPWAKIHSDLIDLVA
jgi:5-methylcytosine-specific restriction enzyme subunit McrC